MGIATRPFVHETGLPPELPGGESGAVSYESRRRAAIGADLPLLPHFSTRGLHLLAALPLAFGLGLLVLACHIVATRYSDFPSALHMLQKVTAALSGAARHHSL